MFVEVFLFEDLHALGIIKTKSTRSKTMASLHQQINKFLTLVLLVIIFALQIAADLAPNEDEFENPKENAQPDLKKPDEVTTIETPKTGSNLGFIHAFIASFSVIIVSEIGDKTFFIAAIMSMVKSTKSN